LLSRIEKLNQTIERKAQDELGAVLKERIEADAQLAERETAAALGDANEASVKSARAKVAGLNSKIDECSSSLAGLRAGVLTLGGDIGRAHGALRKELPAYGASLRENFERRWREGGAAWAALQSERRALELLTGEELKGLPDAAATEFDVGEETRHPYSLLERLEKALRAVVSLHRDGRDHSDVHVHPHSVFKISRDRWGFHAGDLVCEASLPDGRLRALISFEEAHAVKNPHIKEAASAARNALNELDRAQQAEAAEKQRLAELDRRANDDGRPEIKFARMHPGDSPEQSRARYQPEPEPQSKVPPTEYYKDGKRVPGPLPNSVDI